MEQSEHRIRRRSNSNKARLLALKQRLTTSPNTTQNRREEEIMSSAISSPREDRPMEHKELSLSESVRVPQESSLRDKAREL